MTNLTQQDTQALNNEVMASTIEKIQSITLLILENVESAPASIGLTELDVERLGNFAFHLDATQAVIAAAGAAYDGDPVAAEGILIDFVASELATHAANETLGKIFNTDDGRAFASSLNLTAFDVGFFQSVLAEALGSSASQLLADAYESVRQHQNDAGAPSNIGTYLFEELPDILKKITAIDLDEVRANVSAVDTKIGAEDSLRRAFAMAAIEHATFVAGDISKLSLFLTSNTSLEQT